MLSRWSALCVLFLTIACGGSKFAPPPVEASTDEKCGYLVDQLCDTVDECRVEISRVIAVRQGECTSRYLRKETLCAHVSTTAYAQIAVCVSFIEQRVDIIDQTQNVDCNMIATTIGSIINNNGNGLPPECKAIKLSY